ncbi:MAG TPA: minor capsid protein [Candidatus Enterenecus merdae]|nr:minor capsid protein [Candidatus Enterenecus merdae]
MINEIGRLRSRGLIDYHAVAALERVQVILRQMESDSWEYVPRMIEREFYVANPAAYTRAPGRTPMEHLAGYQSALNLTADQQDVVQRLTTALMAEITEAATTSMTTIQDALIGRTAPDLYRRVGLEQVAVQQAVGRGVNQSVPAFVQALRREGVKAFTDRAGRNWSLHTYCTMVSRTTARQAEVLAVLTADPEQDLYRISSHGTTCGLCAPYEGRVYSRSGENPEYPPLSAAFGKRDPGGPDTLANTWLNIHPGCMHALYPYTEAGRTPGEIQQIKDFSNPKKNPFTRDPRTQKQIDAYRKKEQARNTWLENYRQWERYRVTLGDKVPKTFETFQKHKRANDEKYQAWLRAFREANAIEKYSRLRYNTDGTVVVTDRWVAHRSIPSNYRPNAVLETRFPGQQVDRNFYDGQGRLVKQIHSGGHGNPKQHTLGQHGEHAHVFSYGEDGTIIDRETRDLTEAERKENGDIL